MSVTSQVPVEGDYAGEWEAVADVFAHNVQQRGDDGASCCIYRSGHPVLTLWGGHQDRAREVSWRRDTLANVFSAAKPAVAWAILDLVAAGRIELDTPVCAYWPEFASNGKETITTRMLLCHRAGLPALQAPIADDAIYEWDTMVGLLAQEAPAWPPDTAQGYHVFTFGWLLGELVARVSGMSFTDYIETQLRRVHDIDLRFGLLDTELARVAEIEPYLRPEARRQREGRVADGRPRKRPEWQDTLFFKSFHNPPTLAWGTNGSLWRQAVIPGGNGHASGEALARFYGLLVTGDTLLPANMRELCKQELSAEIDQVMGLPGRFSHGFMLNDAAGIFNLGVEADCFGHAGAGGSVAFADPEQELGFSYITRHISRGMMGDRRAHKLIRAVYACLGEGND